MNRLDIIFMGTPELSCATLEKLAQEPSFRVAAVVAQPDKPQGRDLKLRPPPVKILAQKLNLPVLQPSKARDEQFIAQLGELRPNLIVVVAYGHILPPAILDLPDFGCLNVHTSLLPKYRGAAPIQWAIANGETETGVTIMKMDAGMDTGPILSQTPTPILPRDDSAILHERLAHLGAELLAQTIPGYVSGKLLPKPQYGPATLAPKIKKEDGRIDWNTPAQRILNRLRAFTPWPGAFTCLKSESKSSLLKIWKAEVIAASGEPGTVLSADQNGVVIACGKEAIRVLELQKEGGKRMKAGEFLRGSPLTAGQRF